MLEQHQLHALQRELNRADLVPRHCYRRNKVHYELVCFVNNIIGLVLSDNYEVIPVFVGRALNHIKDFPATEETEIYYPLVTRYLEVISRIVLAKGISLQDAVPQPFIDSLQRSVKTT
jgi:hypothetical protein